MFDISFFELVVVAVVALFVIGPERLPETVRTCALWIGRIKRNLLDTRQELEKHLGADEIRRALHNEQVMRNLEKMKDTRAEIEQRLQALGEGNLYEATSDTHSSSEPTSDAYSDHHDTDDQTDNHRSDAHDTGNATGSTSALPASDSQTRQP